MRENLPFNHNTKSWSELTDPIPKTIEIIPSLNLCLIFRIRILFILIELVS